MNKTFRAGNKVYCPELGNEIYTLTENLSENYPLKIVLHNCKETFTKNGKYTLERKKPSLFHVTKENQELLSKLYDVQFEEPKSLLDYYLSLGSKVLCLLCKNKTDNLPNKIWELNHYKHLIDVIVGKENDEYISIQNLKVNWNHIYPIAIDTKGNITYLE